MNHYYNARKDRLAIATEGMQPDPHYIYLGPATEPVGKMLRVHGFSEQVINRILRGNNMQEDDDWSMPSDSDKLYDSPIGALLTDAPKKEEPPQQDSRPEKAETAAQEPEQPAAPINEWMMKQVVEAYIATRDQIKEKKAALDEELKPLKDFQTKREQWLLGQLKNSGLTSANIKGVGTTYQLTQKNVRVSDQQAFIDWVLENPSERISSMDVKASKSEIVALVEDDKPLPPGIDYSTFVTVGVRR